METRDVEDVHGYIGYFTDTESGHDDFFIADRCRILFLNHVKSRLFKIHMIKSRGFSCGFSESHFSHDKICLKIMWIIYFPKFTWFSPENYHV